MPPLSSIPMAAHEEAMRLAIAEARGNPAFPFGAVILRAADRQVMATGVNRGAANPTFHGEIVAINDYVARHGNRGWDELILYTTGEPCPMCTSAMAWAAMSGMVWGTSVAQLREFGIRQILIRRTPSSPPHHSTMARYSATSCRPRPTRYSEIDSAPDRLSLLRAP